MRIITASTQDVPRIMECAREFTSIIPDCPLDESAYGQFWEDMLGSRSGVIFLLEDDGGKVAGGIGGIRHPDLLSGLLQAVELFWYVKAEHRHGTWPVRLLKEFERWAMNSGCVHVSMIHMECSMPERLKEFYERSGYKLFETVYRKRVSR